MAIQTSANQDTLEGKKSQSPADPRKRRAAVSHIAFFKRLASYLPEFFAGVLLVAEVLVLPVLAAGFAGAAAGILGATVANWLSRR